MIRRKFYLINSDGTIKPLNGENGIWFTDPTGLGTTFSKKFSAINKDGFYARTSSQEAQGSISGTITFTQSGYSGYKELVDWMEKAETLTLIYKPGDTEYFRDVEIKSITKTELGEAHWLKCPTAFSCLGPWYRTQTYSQTEAANLNASFTVDNQLGCAFKLCGTVAAAGAITIAQNGATVYQTSYDAAAGAELELRNIPNNTAAIITTSGTEDPANIDVMNTTIPELGPKTGSVIITGPSMSDVTLTIFEYYRSV